MQTVEKAFKVPEFVIDHVFEKLVREDDGQVTYWRETIEGDGYIVYWPDFQDNYHHTYHYPPDIWG